MRVPDEVRLCVVFLTYEHMGEKRFAGTGFYVGHKLAETGDAAALYLVTAAHVVDKIRTLSDDQIVWSRINTKSGGTREIGLPIDQWTRHDDPTVDIALCDAPLGDDLDIRVLFPSNFVNEPIIYQFSIGIGDEVFVTGLFKGHTGQQRNIPIVRVGNIAAMPEEKVRTDLGDAHAYLVEARSTGGLSGSPVFVALGFTRYLQAQVALGNFNREEFYLLGVMHGHWDGQPGPTPAAVTLDDNEKFNTGIGIVTPIGAVLEILRSPALVAARNEAAKAMLPNSPEPN